MAESTVSAYNLFEVDHILIQPIMSRESPSQHPEIISTQRQKL